MLFRSKLRGSEGVEILLVTTDWTSVGGGESCMQIFSHGVECWDRRREKESLADILFHTWRGKKLETNMLPVGMGNGA